MFVLKKKIGEKSPLFKETSPLVRGGTKGKRKRKTQKKRKNRKKTKKF